MFQTARILALLIGLVAVAQVYAQSASHVGLGEYWNAQLAVTYTSWDSLGDLAPAGRGGAFETEGVGFDASLNGSIVRFGRSTVFAGFNFGMAGFNSNVFLESFSDQSAMDLSYAVATLNFRFGDPGDQYVDVDFGIGAYNASNMYIDCVAVPDCFNSEISVTKPGGYAGVSWAMWRGLKIGGRIHYADFGTIGSVGPDSGTLDGPMFTIQVGWEFGDWLQ